MDLMKKGSKDDQVDVLKEEIKKVDTYVAVSPYKMDRVEESIEPNVRWTANLFGCFDSIVPNCLMAFFCGIFPLAQMRQRLGISNYKTMVVKFILMFVLYGVLLACDIVIWNRKYIFGYYAVPFIIFVAVLHDLRMKTRKRYQIPGNCCQDCIVAYTCPCCAIAQLTTQLEIYPSNQCTCTLFSHGVPELSPTLSALEDEPEYPL